MKKLLSVIILTFALTVSVFAQDGGLLNRGVTFEKNKKESGLFGKSDKDENTPNNVALYGTGAAVLMALGVGYGVVRKKKQKKN